MNAAQQLQRPLKIFSGKYSKDLWRLVRKCRPKEHEVIYDMLCRCQELEAVVRNLEARLAVLEDE